MSYVHFDNNKFAHFPTKKYGKTARIIHDFDARYGTDTVVDGVRITYWKDQKNSNYQFDHTSSGFGAVYKASDPTFNGLPSLNFDTADLLYRMILNKFIPLGSQKTLIAVYVADSVTNGRALLANDGGTGANGPQTIVVRPIQVREGTNVYVNSTVSDTNPHIIAFNAINSLMVDGVFYDSLLSLSVYSHGIISIGRNSSVQQFVGRITRLIIFDGIISKGEVAIIYNDLKTLYGL